MEYSGVGRMKKFMPKRSKFFTANSGVDVIGDIHGCYEEFIELLSVLGYTFDAKDQLYKHPMGRKILSLGDITSRGPESLKLLDFFIRHIKEGLAEMVDSNHGWKIARWLDGRRVMLAHGDELVEQQFERYETEHGARRTAQFRYASLQLLMSAPSHIIVKYRGKKALVAVHAGIKDSYIGEDSPTIQNFCRYGDVAGLGPDGRPIRKDWTVEHLSDMLIIWGHDPRPEPERSERQNAINIDQGCVFGGNLTAYRFPEDELVSVVAKTNYSGLDDTPLTRYVKKK